MTGTIVAVTPLHSEAFSRSARMLRTALGPAIAAFLEDPSIVEVMLNPDGRLWIDRLSGGLEDSGRTLSAADGERIVRLVAHHVGAEVHAEKPRVSAELPETGERFEGLLPPVVAAPAFAIRKPAVAVFTLDDYVAAGIMLAGQAAALRPPWQIARTSSSLAAHRPARPRSPMRCWPRSPAPPTAWC
jgi:Flp pilus assembly CpaF family ATPase